MLRKNPSVHYSQVSEKVFIDPTAILCGNTIVEDKIFVGSDALIRTDEVDEAGSIQPILIERDSNIQDGVVIHSKAGAAVAIGERISVAHRLIVHWPGVIDGLNIPIPDSFHVPPMTNIGPGFDLNTIAKAPPEYSSFSESVLSANHALGEGYKRKSNEF
jgi:hypothetical protein